MQPRRRALALLALVLTATICTAPELCAQDGKAAVETAIMRVFEGMHTANPDMVRAVFAPDACFAVISASNGPAVIAAQTVDGWIEAIGGSEGRWDEQVYDLDINVDGDMASPGYRTPSTSTAPVGTAASIRSSCCATPRGGGLRSSPTHAGLRTVRTRSAGVSPAAASVLQW